jgi:hypothetical protein
MKTLYDPANAEEIRQRLQRLAPTSEREWGKMNPAQMLAHCAAAMETAVGDSKPPRMMIGRVLGGLAKSMSVNSDKPFSRNGPTGPNLRITDQRQFDVEKERLSQLVERFVQAGRTGCTTHPHNFFGRMTADEWGVLMYKHLDHHFRQFGA